MNLETKIQTLSAEINKSLLVLACIEDYIVNFQRYFGINFSGHPQA